jgi:cysteinyl-tRNA synthetase
MTLKHDHADNERQRFGPRGISLMLASLVIPALPFVLSGCAPIEDGNNDLSQEVSTSDGSAGTQGGEDGGRVTQDQPGLLYLLQPGGIAVEQVIEQAFTYLILEPSRTGDAAGEFSREEIEAIRTTGPCGGKIVLAYLSVGEAEDYRDYWNRAWVDGDEGPPIPGVAPEWLGPPNPDFAGNYKVRYWHPQWQYTTLGTPDGPDKTPLDRIIDAGFDGVYLDIIDAYDYWSGPAGGNELTRAEARELMIEWVRTISEYARVTRGLDGFLVFPQNASDIIRNDDYELDELSDAYFTAIDGIGIEDLFYDETRVQPEDQVDYRMEQLTEYRERGKTVLVTDYVLRESFTPGNSDGIVADFYRRTLDAGFIPYAAVENRDLDEVATLSTMEWSVSQPPAECTDPID